MLFGGLFHKWFINVDNFGQFWSTEWANCRSVWLISPLVIGVAGLSASSSSKADTLNIWCENCEMLHVTLDNNWDNEQAVLLLIFFRMHCYRYRLVFNCCFKNTDISLGSVATHLRCGGIFSDNVTTNFILISTVKKFKNRFIFYKVIGV